MARVRWCNLCQRNVVPRKNFNWFAFLILLGIFYAPFYLLQGPRCPICNGKSFGSARRQ